MSYLVLARKWRPQTFTDLVGQEHVAQTLKNAISQGRIAHAFLFTGARGVGKTTIARVMAKALNCMSAKGPTPEPCGKCSACEEIARSNDVDVKEIDGASNNSVEDVRKLQESLPYLPVRDRFKVVIIDEVHMLSTGAFNALLKTLEEPPPHVKFIFATTEVHKVPITILSRCQRYDFKLIPTQKIRDRIAYILGQENIAFDDAAVALVAREAAGSMRDALSLLDQVIAGVAGKLTGEEAGRLLGVANRSVMYDLARALLAGDAVKALETVQSLASEGFDLATVSRHFLAVLRDLVVAKVVPEPGELLDLADEERGDVLAIAKAADRADLERLFAAWSRTVDEVARAREQRWVLEMALVRLAHRPPLVPVDELVARLGDLERRLGAGGEPPRGPAPGGGGSGAGGGARGGATGGAGSRPVSTPGSAGAPRFAPSSESSASNSVASARATATAAPVVVPVPLATPVNTPAPSPAPITAPVTASVAAAAKTAATPAWLTRVQSRVAEPTVTPDPTPAVTPLATPAPARSAAPAADRIDTAGATALLDPWERVLAQMDNGPTPILRHAVPLEVSGESVRVAFESGSFYARKVANPECEGLIADAAAKVFGARPAASVVQGGLADDAPTLARRDEARKAAVRAQLEAEAKAHPFVQKVLEALGGEIKTVKLDEKDS